MHPNILLASWTCAAVSDMALKFIWNVCCAKIGIFPNSSFTCYLSTPNLITVMPICVSCLNLLSSSQPFLFISRRAVSPANTATWTILTTSPPQTSNQLGKSQNNSHEPREKLFIFQPVKEFCSYPPLGPWHSSYTVALPKISWVVWLFFFFPSSFSHLEKKAFGSLHEAILFWCLQKSMSLTLLLQKLEDCLMIFQILYCSSPQLSQWSHFVPILSLLFSLFKMCSHQFQGEIKYFY